MPAILPASSSLEKQTKSKIGLKLMPNRSAAVAPRPHVDKTSSLTGGGKKLWNYMLGFLPESSTAMTFDEQTAKLFEFPRRRLVKWRETWDEHRAGDNKYQILGLLLYLIGEEVKRECTNCRRGQGPFPRCMILPEDAEEELQKLVRCCSNCYFVNCRSACSLKFKYEARWSRKSLDDTTPASLPAETTAIASKKRRFADLESEDDVNRNIDSGQPSNGSEDEDQPDQDQDGHRRKIVTLTLPSATTAKMSRTRSMTAGLQTTTNAASSVLISAGQIQPDDVLEMEDWEIAPGCIRATGTELVDSKRILTCSTRLRTKISHS